MLVLLLASWWHRAVLMYLLVGNRQNSDKCMQINVVSCDAGVGVLALSGVFAQFLFLQFCLGRCMSCGIIGDADLFRSG